MFGNLLKAVVGVATLPVDIAVDVVKMPVDAYDGKVFPNTVKKASNVMDNLHDAVDPNKKDWL